MLKNQQKLAKRIKKIREDFGISQEEFAQKIGLSRVALSQLELGKRGLEALELAVIAKTLGVSVDFLLPGDDKPKKEKSEKIIFKFEPEKLKNLLLYILNKCGGKPNLGETVLYKLLYYIDFDCFEINGKPVTGMNYIKLQFGPVPKISQFNRVIDNMIVNKEVEVISRDYHGMIQKRYVAWKNYDINVFKPSELEIIDSVISRFSDMNAKQIEDYVHGDAPWQIVGNKEVIDYNLVFERVAPYAYRNYESLWQDMAANDTLKDLGPITEKEYNYYESL